MKVNSLVTAAVLASVLLLTSSASAAQFTFNDILKSAPGNKAFSTGKIKKQLRRAPPGAFKTAAASTSGFGSGQGVGSGAGGGGGGGGGSGSGGRAASSGTPKDSGGGGSVGGTGLGVVSDPAQQQDVTKVQFLVIAQAKLGGQQKHPSSPKVTVDVEAKIPGCKPFDWLFIPHCSDSAPRSDVSLPKFNTVQLPRAYLHIFQLPYGWKNARITLPAFGKCQSARTAAMRAARPGDSLCRTAQFRSAKKTPKKECKRVPYFPCGSYYRGLRCRRRYRTQCTTKNITTYMECSRTFLVIRVFTVDDQIPQVVATTGGVYSGFRSCNDAAATKYFTK